MFTAIVTSDNHLGTYYARFRPETLERRRQQLQSGFRQVVDTAIEDKADLFLHAGDLYDTPTPRNADRTFVARQFQRLRDAGIPAYAIVGNHDSPRSYGYDGGIAPLEEMREVQAVHLFRHVNKWEPIVIDVNGVKVGLRGLSYDFSTSEENCPLESLADSAERCGEIDLVLLHYGVEKWGDYPGEPCLSLANLDRLQADVVCVGHLHKRNKTQLPGGAILLNPGATEHIRFGEEHLECGCWKLRGEPGNVQAEYIRVDTVPMQTLDFDMGNFAPNETENDMVPHTLHDQLLKGIENVCHDAQILRARLRGRLNRRHLHELDIAALLDFGQKRNFHFQLETEDLALYDELADWHIEIGFNFDVQQELQRVVESLRPNYAEDETRLDVHLEAGRAIEDAYLRLMGAK